jgi:polyisoprenoid-binding protein YceI
MYRVRFELRACAAAFAFAAASSQMTGCSNPADNKFQVEALPAKPRVAMGLDSVKAEDAVNGAAVAVTSEAAPAGVKTVKAVVADSKIEFTGSKVTGSHSGGFKAFTAEAVVDPVKKSLIDFKTTIDMDSTWSDNDRLTGHLKNQDFFDVPKFPTSKFETTQIDSVGDDKLPGSNTMIVGNLTLHGVTKSIRFPAKVDIAESGAVTLNTEFAINRKDFGIEYAGKTDDLIRDEVVIRLAVKAE